MAGEAVVVVVGQVEPQPQRHGHRQDEQLGRHEPQPRRPHPTPEKRPAEQNREARDADHRDRRVDAGDLGRQVGQRFERLARRFLAEHHRQLLEKDDQSDRREHAVHDGRRKEVGQRAHPQQSEHDLHEARHAAHRDHHPVGGQVGRRIGSAGEAERLHRAQHDHDQARRRPLDRELGVADQARDDRAHGRREDAGHRRKSARQRDPQAQGQRDQEHEKPARGVGPQVADEARHVAAGCGPGGDVGRRAGGWGVHWGTPCGG